MRTRTVIGVIGMLVLASGLATDASPRRAVVLDAGGTETVGEWQPGQGVPAPGAKLRGWVARYDDVLVGAAGELASGAGPVVMNCNLDQQLTGPCWGTFEIENAHGTWTGVWQGTFNFVTGAGSYRAIGYGQGGLKGLTLCNDVVYPGYAFPVNGVPTGYIYSTVRGRSL